MSYKSIFIIFLFIQLFCGCQNRADRDQQLVYQIPDSLRTEEEKVIVRKLKDVLLHDIVVENNEMVLKLKKQEFIDRGIPEKYYDLIKRDLRENNKLFNASEEKLDVEQMVQDLKSQILGLDSIAD